MPYSGRIQRFLRAAGGRGGERCSLPNNFSTLDLSGRETMLTKVLELEFLVADDDALAARLGDLDGKDVS